MNRINRQSKLPLYHQLYEILRDDILSGEWQPGDMIPPESELVKRYQVSRTTVRQVLDMLVNEGLIYRQQGRGTFVAHPTVEQALVRIISFTDDMRQRGFKPGTTVLSSGLIPAPQDIAEKLEVEPGEEEVWAAAADADAWAVSALALVATASAPTAEGKCHISRERPATR